MKKIAIQGSQDPVEQQEILKILRSWGGMNSNGYLCNTEGYYYVNYNNTISLQHGIFLPEFELLTLEEYKNKYMSKENNKELQIVAPEGYEIDKENSTLEKIVFKKVEEKLTYTKIVNELFTGKRYYYTNDYGTIKESADPTKVNDFCDTDPNNAPTKHQLEKLLALNKLMNVAYYLNDGWKPDWDDGTQKKFFIYYDSTLNTIRIDYNKEYNYGVVYFKSREFAGQAIKILGEETIKLALGI